MLLIFFGNHIRIFMKFLQSVIILKYFNYCCCSSFTELIFILKICLNIKIHQIAIFILMYKKPVSISDIQSNHGKSVSYSLHKRKSKSFPQRKGCKQFIVWINLFKITAPFKVNIIISTSIFNYIL